MPVLSIFCLLSDDVVGAHQHHWWKGLLSVADIGSCPVFANYGHIPTHYICGLLCLHEFAILYICICFCISSFSSSSCPGQLHPVTQAPHYLPISEICLWSALNQENRVKLSLCVCGWSSTQCLSVKHSRGCKHTFQTGGVTDS